MGPQVGGSYAQIWVQTDTPFVPPLPTAVSILAVTAQPADLLALSLPVPLESAVPGLLSLAFCSGLAQYPHPFVLVLSLGPCSL